MKKITILFFACVVLIAGCRWAGIRGNGNIKTDERTIGAFANLRASGAFTIEWQNGAPALRITTDENLLPERLLSVSRQTKIFSLTSTLTSTVTRFACARANTFGRLTESRL